MILKGRITGDPAFILPGSCQQHKIIRVSNLNTIFIVT
jgi:hypothetical protein